MSSRCPMTPLNGIASSPAVNWRTIEPAATLRLHSRE